MSGFSFQPKAKYRMPVMFGPTVGPRQGPDGGRFSATGAPFTVTSARFLSQRAALMALLPEGFALDGDPVVTIEHTVLHDLAWLGGRSYSMLGVKLPVIFDGADEQLRGALLTVLWENRAEPILSGREELGFNKVYCELPKPLSEPAGRMCHASWDGFEFLRLRVSDLQDARPPAATPSDGVLHYAYRPQMGENIPHQDCTRVMLSPAPSTAVAPKVYQTGKAELTINKATFQQMPTMYQIVNVLADLPVVEMLGGSYIESSGKGDLSDQRLVRQKSAT